MYSFMRKDSLHHKYNFEFIFQEIIFRMSLGKVLEKSIEWKLYL